MSSGSKGMLGVRKARTGKKGVETMMTQLDKFKEFTIDEFRDEEVSMAETTITSFCFAEKASGLVRTSNLKTVTSRRTC